MHDRCVVLERLSIIYYVQWGLRPVARETERQKIRNRQRHRVRDKGDTESGGRGR